MEDEPLAEWAERRERRRAGRYRMVTLAPGGPQGDHVNPGAPRLISRWNGYEWEAVGIAANLAEAKRIMYPPAPSDDPPPPRRGPGKHRKPPATP